MTGSNQPNCKVEIQNDLKFVQDTLYVLSGKWKLPIVISIYNGHHRYREIAKAVPGLTFRMLSRELNVLELNKLITREEQEGPPKTVDYRLTDYCQSLYPLLEDMIEWAKQHRQVIR